jgi:hypothetical protein
MFLQFVLSTVAWKLEPYPWNPGLILASPDINLCAWEVLLRSPVEACTSEIAHPITSIPEAFKVFQKVFSNDFFTMLPAHCSYDCAIPLKDAKDVP